MMKSNKVLLYFRNRWLYIILISILLSNLSFAGSTEGNDNNLPPEPTDPKDMHTCSTLYGAYQIIIERHKADAAACMKRYPVYAQTRYGRPAGVGECARNIVAQCRSHAMKCSAVRETARAALGRCQQAVRNNDMKDE